MPERQYAEVPFYDFDRNYQDAVTLLREVFGDRRASAVAAAKGKDHRADFMTAITWGWLYHRPILSRLQRAWVIIGNTFAQKNYPALRDHAQWALAEGAHREKVREAIFTFSVYGGVPNTIQGLEVVEDLFAELDRAGWRPPREPDPLPNIPERKFYDFEENFTAGVDLTLRRGYGGGAAGGDRASRLARMGRSSVGDFNAIHWGWMMHRPYLLPTERCLVLIGADTANKAYLALKDHTQWGLLEGLTREQVDEALFTLYLFNGWPANRQATVAIAELYQELDQMAQQAQQAQR